MRIEIVVADDGHVLPRLAAKIAEEMDDCYVVGLQPTPHADVALFMPYAAYYQRAANLSPDTVKVAWFTHFETAAPGKMSMWHRAARAMDMRIITAPVYKKMLEPHGPTRVLVPGVDTDFFKVGTEPTKLSRGRFGTTFIDSPRKRRDIIDFVARELGDEYTNVSRIVKTPEHANYAPPEEMRDWYRHLQVYICTSTEEGIPMPVLEAGASGCRIVMPRGVGVEPFLPEDYVWRYTAGDAVDCLRATREAFAPRIGVGVRRTEKSFRKVFPFSNWTEQLRRICEEAYEAKSSGRV